eukprot:4240496-Amphidinium_carterae.1
MPPKQGKTPVNTSVQTGMQRISGGLHSPHEGVNHKGSKNKPVTTHSQLYSCHAPILATLIMPTALCSTDLASTYFSSQPRCSCQGCCIAQT